MSKGTYTLREQIKHLSHGAARVLDDAELTDADLLTLTRQDLNELLPGPKNFKIRRKIAELINSAAQESPVSSSSLIERLKHVISRADVKNLLISGGLLQDYLHVLRDIEVQLVSSLDCVRQHRKLLESLQTASPPPEGVSGYEAAVGRSHPHAEDEAHSNLNRSNSPVQYHSLLCGKTLGFHIDVLKYMKVPTMEVSLDECKVVLVFCPMASRAGTDITAALRNVPEHKDAILVTMHYTTNPQYSLSTLRQYVTANIKEAVHILFHDSMGGILNCDHNRQAIATIEAAMKKYTNIQ